MQQKVLRLHKWIFLQNYPVPKWQFISARPNIIQVINHCSPTLRSSECTLWIDGGSPFFMKWTEFLILAKGGKLFPPDSCSHPSSGHAGAHGHRWAPLPAGRHVEQLWVRSILRLGFVPCMWSVRSGRCALRSQLANLCDTAKSTIGCVKPVISGCVNVVLAKLLCYYLRGSISGSFLLT